jgi:hypothetical protein
MSPGVYQTCLAPQQELAGNQDLQILRGAAGCEEAGEGMNLDLRYRWHRLSERLLIKLAWMIPRQLCMWCAIRVMAHATQGKYENQIVPDLLAMDALKRWDEPA